MKPTTLIRVAGVLGFAWGTCVAAVAQTTTRASVDSGGAQANSNSYASAISADGRRVAFVSHASNLVAGDTNDAYDVFVRDLVSGTTERVSVGSGGMEADNDSFRPSVSGDGRFVAFSSYASNLVAGPLDAFMDIFVRDRLTGTTEEVSVGPGGLQANDQSQVPSISADGRYVVFWSDATNLVAGDTNGKTDVFVHDRAAGTTERVSVASGGSQANDASYWPSISADGRWVAFSSLATNLVAGDSNGTYDVFVRDRLSGTTERVSVDSVGVEGNASSGETETAISGDGRVVAFRSYATNLVAGDDALFGNLFLHDRLSGTTEFVDVDVGGGIDGHGDAYQPSISHDGRYVAFYSNADNLISGDTNLALDAYLRDRLTRITERVSVSSSGAQGNFGSEMTSISADGRSVAFTSLADNLVPGDTNSTSDVLVRDRGETIFTAFCFPDFSGVRPCPCRNPAASSDVGCDSFIAPSTVSGSGGAKLTVSGIPNATPSNTLVFHVTGAHNPAGNTNVHVLWRGTATIPAGAKSGFGVRCVAGALKRIYTGTGTGTGGLGSTNAVDFPNGTQTTDAWTASQMPAAGTTVLYYDAFRDMQGPTTCNTPGDRFNVSHAGALTWIP